MQQTVIKERGHQANFETPKSNSSIDSKPIDDIHMESEGIMTRDVLSSTYDFKNSQFKSSLKRSATNIDGGRHTIAVATSDVSHRKSFFTNIRPFQS